MAPDEVLSAFIVHSNEDYPLVQKIYDRCRFPWIRCCIAEQEKRPGELLTGKIEELLVKCQVIIAVWTHNLRDSIMANQEIGYAKALGKKIIPFAVRGMKPEGFLEGLEYVEYDPYDPEKGIENLIVTLTKLAQNFGYIKL